MTRHLEVRTRCAAPRPVMFDLARSQQSHLDSMAYSHEQIRNGPDHDLLELGDCVTFTGRHFGLPFSLTGQITAMVRHDYFVDEQASGPFAALRHEHRFLDLPGGCLMIDRIDFTAPLGIAGLFAEKLILARYLTRLIRNRGRFLADLAAGTPR